MRYGTIRKKHYRAQIAEAQDKAERLELLDLLFQEAERRAEAREALEER